MGKVRDIINSWLPKRFSQFPRWVELMDVIAEVFEEMHDAIGSYPTFYDPDKIGLKVVEEIIIATGDGSTKTFVINLIDYPIENSTVLMKYTIGGIEYIAVDKGKRVIGTFLYNAHVNEVLGIGDSSTSIFSGVLSNIPALASNIILEFIIDSTTYTVVDDGAGNFSSAQVNGTIDYVSGVIELIFNIAPDASTNIEVDYYETDTSDSIIDYDTGLLSLVFFQAPDSNTSIRISYTSVDIDWLDYLSRMFNVPDKLKELSVQKRRFFLNRVSLLIQMIGLEDSLDLIGGLLNITITPIILWANDDYDTFSQTEIPGGFKSTHLRLEIVKAEDNNISYTVLIDEFIEYFNFFKGIEIVVDEHRVTLSQETMTPRIISVLTAGSVTTIYPE